MSELSPAAQAVLDAVCATTEPDCSTEYLIAAALRAATDLVVPEENVDEADYDCLQAKWAAQGKQETREAFLVISTELETHQ